MKVQRNYLSLPRTFSLAEYNYETNRPEFYLANDCNQSAIMSRIKGWGCCCSNLVGGDLATRNNWQRAAAEKTLFQTQTQEKTNQTHRISHWCTNGCALYGKYSDCTPPYFRIILGIDFFMHISD